MKFAEIQQQDIVYDRSFRTICEQNQCGEYGRCWVCPPDVGTLDELMNRAKSYPRGILYQCFYPLEDSYDVEGMDAGKRAFVKCSLEITKALNAMKSSGQIRAEDYMQLAVGACGICEKCARRDNQPCRFPELAIPSLESAGIFVAQTAQNAGMNYINGENTVTYFGMVLFR